MTHAAQKCACFARECRAGDLLLLPEALRDDPQLEWREHLPDLEAALRAQNATLRYVTQLVPAYR